MPLDALLTDLATDSLLNQKARGPELAIRGGSDAKSHFVPSFPLKIMQDIVAVDGVATLPLVLAIHRQLTMTRREETPLNGAIWSASGSPSLKKREMILRKLKTLTQIIELRIARTGSSYYKVRRGSSWTP